MSKYLKQLTLGFVIIMQSALFYIPYWVGRLGKYYNVVLDGSGVQSANINEIRNGLTGNSFFSWSINIDNIIVIILSILAILLLKFSQVQRKIITVLLMLVILQLVLIFLSILNALAIEISGEKLLFNNAVGISFPIVSIMLLTYLAYKYKYRKNLEYPNTQSSDNF